jgi:hypothetical protein
MSQLPRENDAGYTRADYKVTRTDYDNEKDLRTVGTFSYGNAASICSSSKTKMRIKPQCPAYTIRQDPAMHKAIINMPPKR